MRGAVRARGILGVAERDFRSEPAVGKSLTKWVFKLRTFVCRCTSMSFTLSHLYSMLFKFGFFRVCCQSFFFLFASHLLFWERKISSLEGKVNIWKAVGKKPHSSNTCMHTYSYIVVHFAA